MIFNKLAGRVPWPLWPILAIGGFLRIYGFRHGYPFSFHIDEWHILRDSLEMYRQHSLRPPTFDYPALLYYYYEALAAAIGLFRPPTLSLLHLAGRISSALWATAAIAATYRMAKMHYGSTVGWLAAAFLAFTVTALREAHFATVDTINAFFIILALDRIARIAIEGTKSDYVWSGFLIGLVSATKYNGFMLAAPLLLAHLLRGMPSAVSVPAVLRSLWPLHPFSNHRPLLLSALAAAAVFFCANPYAVLDPVPFAGFLGGKLFRMSSGIEPWNHHYLNTPPYLYYIQNLLFWGMGPVLEAAGIGGILYLAIRRRKADLIFICWVFVYFALVGSWLNKASRYAVPMLPFLAVAAAAFLVEAKGYFQQRRWQMHEWGCAVLAGIVLSTSLLYSLAFLRVYSRPHTGIQALQWTLRSIPENATVLLEPTEWERPPIDGGVPLISGSLSQAGPERFRFEYLDILKYAAERTPSPELVASLNRTLARVDYIVISMRWYEGFINSPLVSPILRKYYQDLLANRGDFQKVAEFNSYPGFGGMEWNDDRAELNFRIFDHPKVLVFKRCRNK